MQTDTLKNTDTPKWMIKIIQLTHRQVEKKTWKEKKKTDLTYPWFKCSKKDVLTYPWLSLNLNALNTPIQIHRLAQRIKDMTQLHAIYNTFTSNITEWSGWEKRNWKNIL